MLKAGLFSLLSLAAAAASGATLVFVRFAGGLDLLVFIAAIGLLAVAAGAAWIAQEAAVDDFAAAVLKDHQEAHYDQGF